MFCPSCGTNNNDNAQFCAKCGTPLGAQAPQQLQPQAQPQAVVAPKKEGAFVRGFKDIVSSSGWFVTYLKLLALSLFPFLNFLPNGYALNWGADLVQGKRESLPKEVFNHRCFSIGFLYWLISIICFWVSVPLLLINIIPIAGVIAAFIAIVFITGWGYIAAIRVSLQKRFSAAFDFSIIFKAFVKSPWSLLCAVFLPSLIVFAIILVIAILLCVLVVAPAVVTSSLNVGSLFSPKSSSSSRYATSSSNVPWSIVLNLFMGMGPALGLTLGIVLLVSFLLSTFTNLWIIRSVSYWVSENAPEWAVPEIDSAHSSRSWL